MNNLINSVILIKWGEEYRLCRVEENPNPHYYNLFDVRENKHFIVLTKQKVKELMT